MQLEEAGSLLVRAGKRQYLVILIKAAQKGDANRSVGTAALIAGVWWTCWNVIPGSTRSTAATGCTRGRLIGAAQSIGYNHRGLPGQVGHGHLIARAGRRGRQVAVGRRIVYMRARPIEIEDVDAVWLLCGVCQS